MEVNGFDVKGETKASDKVYQRHQRKKNDASFIRYKNILFILSYILGIILICLTYFQLDLSKIKAIRIIGNDYLDDSKILDLSKLTLNNRYYLTIPFFVEQNLLKSDLIESAQVQYTGDHVISIQVTEQKVVGYRYIEDPEILLANGKTVPLTSDTLEIITRVPIIRGFEDEQALYLLTKSLGELDKSQIENISEISQYPMVYDENTIELFLRDGNYIFTSYYGLKLLNAYTSIATNLTESGQCIFLDDGQKVAFKKVCPWDEVIPEVEYWTNDEGQYILNRYGDRVVIHYYLDKDGNPLLDENGNKIPIRVNEYGEEIIEDVYTNNE